MLAAHFFGWMLNLSILIIRSSAPYPRSPDYCIMLKSWSGCCHMKGLENGCVFCIHLLSPLLDTTTYIEQGRRKNKKEIDEDTWPFSPLFLVFPSFPSVRLVQNYKIDRGKERRRREIMKLFNEKVAWLSTFFLVQFQLSPNQFGKKAATLLASAREIVAF